MSERTIPPFGSARLRGGLAAACIAVAGTCEGLMAFVRLADTSMLRAAAPGAYLAELYLYSQRSAGLLLDVSGGCFGLIAAVFFLAWFHRVHRNLRALGARDLEYSPDWAIGGFFVPVLNMWRPLQVMSEVREHSDPHGAPDGGETLERVWWLAFVGANLLAWQVARTEIGTNPTVGSMLAASWLGAAGGVLSAVSAVCAILLIRQIDRNQGLLHRRVQRRAELEGVAAPDAACSSCGAILTPEAKRCGFCGSRRLGTGIGCGGVAGRVIGGVVVLCALAVWGFQVYLEAHGSPPNRALAERYVPRPTVEFLEREGIVEPGERVLWLYSTGFLSAEEGGYVITPDRVVHYAQLTPDAVWKDSVRFEDVVDVQAVWGSGWIDDTAISLVRAADETEADPADGLADDGLDAGDAEDLEDLGYLDGDAPAFSLRMSTSLGSDRAVMETLRERLPDLEFAVAPDA